MPSATILQSLLIALGIGLLMGAERERRKSRRKTPATAGIRTFAVASLSGALAMHLGGVLLLSIMLASTAAYAAIGYWRSRDEDAGLTTECALLAAVLLGAQSLTAPALAGGIAVLLTVLLAVRDPLHRFVGDVMTKGEVADILSLAAATLVVLPLLPNRAMGPFEALNPHSMWLVVILVLAIGTAGRVLTRWLGARLGVPLLGLVSGFISSSATIGAMGAWSRRAPMLVPVAAAAAVLSTVATFVQLGLVIWMTDAASFAASGLSILAAIAMAGLLGGGLTLAAWRTPAAPPPDLDRGISLALALFFSATLGAILIFSAALRSWLGEPGLVLAAAIGGVFDVHAASIALAAQVGAGKITPSQAVLPLLAAWTSSGVAKIILALTAGPRGFALRVMPAQLLIVLAAWAMAWAGGLVLP
ncbi:MAG: hypothetical protein RL764_559 [Pseudomonadota bacterium]